MELNFTPVRTRAVAMNDFAAGLSLEQLRLLTEASVERMLALLDAATDADVVFVPDDPNGFGDDAGAVIDLTSTATGRFGLAARIRQANEEP